MHFIDYEITDTYYKFIGENGIAFLAPINSIILVNDESGFLTIKTVGSRKTIGTVNP